MLITEAAPPAESPVLPAAPSPLDRLLRALSPPTERRRTTRVAAPHLFRITPLMDLGRGRSGPPAGPARTVVGKDLSEHGFCFYHEEPLTARYVRIAIDDPQIGAFEFDVQLNRTRFSKLGWYESAGRVLNIRG